jgi:hypothetical protein
MFTAAGSPYLVPLDGDLNQSKAPTKPPKIGLDFVLANRAS